LPQHWSYAEAHDALEAAGDLIDVEKAERRNLILRNAMPGNDWATSRTLVCAYQMILPGEVAPSHRHTSNALRVIIDGTGSYSIVDGDKMPMDSGDVVLTPGGHWHGHGHEGDTPAYWLDCLDVPLTYLLEPMYFEGHPAKYEPVERIVEESPFRFSRDSIARGLDKAIADPAGCHGPRITLDTSSMPTVGLVVERLETGKSWAERRTTSNRIFTVMSGTGSSIVAGNTVSWCRGDTFLVPSSNWVGHRASQDAVLLEMSDEPLMRFANYFQSNYR
jgi:gentisate 1,2-dioxygenase